MKLRTAKTRLKDDGKSNNKMVEIKRQKKDMDVNVQNDFKNDRNRDVMVGNEIGFDQGVNESMGCVAGGVADLAM